MDKLSSILVKYVGPFPSKDILDDNLTALEKKELVRKALMVGVDAVFFKNSGLFSTHYSDENHRQFLQTLEVLADASKNTGLEFLIFKTIGPFRFIKNDIDVFVRDSMAYSNFSVYLKSKGFASGHTLDGELELNKDGHVQVDLHSNISWDYLGRGGAGPTLFDLKGFWENRRKLSYEGLEISVPSPEDEIVVLLAHSIFQHHYLTLGDAIFIGELVRTNSVDFNRMFETGINYGWVAPMKEMLSAVKTWYKRHWDVELDIPLPSISLKSSLVFVPGPKSTLLSFFVYINPFSLRSLYEACVGISVSFYRFLYYVKIKKALAFNPLPQDWRFDDN